MKFLGHIIVDIVAVGFAIGIVVALVDVVLAKLFNFPRVAGKADDKARAVIGSSNKKSRHSK